MKKTIFIVTTCFLFTFCSRKTVPPPPAGISNVSVGSGGDTMTKASAVSLTSANRDWAYRASRDTTLNGTWTLDGMIGADGSWTSMQANTQATQSTDTALSVSGSEQTSTANSGSRKTRKNRRALYDSANAKLKLDYKGGPTGDTSAIPPFQYWKRIPTVTIDAQKQVFNGNTGCNSMSGPFHFSDKDIQFGRNIVTSKMACNEYDENVFLSALQRADSYTLNGNVLELRQGGTLVLTFRKS